jgi:hypothetical protein
MIRSAYMSLRVDEASVGEALILHNLSELYVHDFSEVTLTELHEAGRFNHDFWRGCWSGGDRTPYLFRVADRLAGFAIIDRGSRITGDSGVHHVAEVFVVRRYRREASALAQPRCSSGSGEAHGKYARGRATRRPTRSGDTRSAPTRGETSKSVSSPTSVGAGGSSDSSPELRRA